MLSALAIVKATAAAAEADAAAAALLWKQAKTLFFGNAALQSMSPSATSDKRCGNYDTCAAGGDASKTNIAIYDAFAAGEADPTTYADNAAIISAQNTIVYMQATLRYLNKMDKLPPTVPGPKLRPRPAPGLPVLTRLPALLVTMRARQPSRRQRPLLLHPLLARRQHL